MPDPTRTIIANEKLPRTGIFLYHAKLAGNSQKKSDTGPIKAKILLTAANTLSIPSAPSYRFKLTVCLFIIKQIQKIERRNFFYFAKEKGLCISAQALLFCL
jgi:hypothetical protein